MDKDTLKQKLIKETTENKELKSKSNPNQLIHDSIINIINKVIRRHNNEIRYYRRQYKLHPILRNNPKRKETIISLSISDNTKISQIGNMLTVNILNDIYGLNLKVFSKDRIQDIKKNSIFEPSFESDLKMISSSATVKDLINRITFFVKPTMYSPQSTARRKSRLARQNQSSLRFP